MLGVPLPSGMVWYGTIHTGSDVTVSSPENGRHTDLEHYTLGLELEMGITLVSAIGALSRHRPLAFSLSPKRFSLAGPRILVSAMLPPSTLPPLVTPTTKAHPRRR